MKIKWKIYYGDGSTFTDGDGLPQDAPCRNIQVIAQVSDVVGQTIIRNTDFYIFSEELGGWEGVDNYGLWDYLSDPGLKIVKFGRIVTNQRWYELQTVVKNDDYLPPKTAWFKHERRLKG